MINAFKEQTPLVVYSYRSDQTGSAGRDGFEEVANQEQIVQPFTKHTWLARCADMIPETVRRAFKASWTPPYGPSYISWHKDDNGARVRTDIVAQNQIDPRMRGAAESAGDRTRRQAADRSQDAADDRRRRDHQGQGGAEGGEARRIARHAGDAGTPDVRQLPRAASALGRRTAGRHAPTPITWPKDSDVVINVGNKIQHNSPAPIVPRNKKFIDMRIDHWSMGNVMLTEVPLVSDVGYGLDDLIAAVEQLVTPTLKQKFAARTDEVKKFTTQARTLCAGIVNSPDWNDAPLIADRVTSEIAQFADKDAIIVHEAGSVVAARIRFQSGTAGASCSSTTARISAPEWARRRA